jgi:hypothetical protein
MGLEGVIEKLSGAYSATKSFVGKEKNYFMAAGLFLSTRALDATLTHKFFSAFPGVIESVEAMPLTRHFMHLYGMDIGLALHQTLASTLVLGVAYYLNKNTKIKGTEILNGASIASFAIAANNFYIYLKALKMDGML